MVTLGSKDGLTFGTGDGVEDELMQFVGVLPNVNAALASLTYRGLLDFNGADNITITVSDQTHRGTGPALTDTAVIAVAVTPVNDQPTLVVPAKQTVAEDSTLSIEGVRVFDVEASKSPSKQMQMSLYVVGGTLSLKQTSGLNFSTGDGVSDPAMQFTGSLADLNKALQNLSYVGDEDFNSNHHAEFLKVYVNDLGSTIGGGGALTTEAVVPITVNAVNDAPSIVSPLASTMSQKRV